MLIGNAVPVPAAVVLLLPSAAAAFLSCAVRGFVILLRCNWQCQGNQLAQSVIPVARQTMPGAAYVRSICSPSSQSVVALDSRLTALVTGTTRDKGALPRRSAKVTLPKRFNIWGSTNLQVLSRLDQNVTTDSSQERGVAVAATLPRLMNEFVQPHSAPIAMQPANCM